MLPPASYTDTHCMAFPSFAPFLPSLLCAMASMSLFSRSSPGLVDIFTLFRLLPMELKQSKLDSEAEPPWSDEPNAVLVEEVE